jgi:predicted transcriptional regulator with HTH domain
MDERDQERINEAVKILRQGDVDFYSCRNEHGYIFPSDFPMLIKLGLAEEVRENGVTWLRLKETEGP